LKEERVDEVWEIMDSFDALFLEEIPREMNLDEAHEESEIGADVLAVSTSTSQRSNESVRGRDKMEVIGMPSIPDNLEHGKDFNDDEQILIFINNLQEFSEFEVDWEEDRHEYMEGSEHKENPPPKGLISSEQLFNRHHIHKKKKEIIKPGDCIKMDVESYQDPRMIKIEKSTSEKRRKKLINLVKDHRDDLAFTHDEFKACNEDVIQHTIPIKEYAKPFKEKLRKINYKFSPWHKGNFRMSEVGVKYKRSFDNSSQPVGRHKAKSASEWAAP
jgi:hypothetical protein